MESLYHLESFNFLEQTNKPVISLLITLYWKQPLLNPWHPFDKMKRCLKTFYGRKTQGLLKCILNSGNALRRKDCIIRANNCTTIFFLFPILYLKLLWCRFETLPICSCLYKSNTLKILLCYCQTFFAFKVTYFLIGIVWSYLSIFCCSKTFPYEISIS